MTFIQQKERLAFQRLCNECQCFEAEIRQSTLDPAQEWRWRAIWAHVSQTRDFDERVRRLTEHRDSLVNEVRKLAEARWQIIASINN